ncbi:MAG: DNA-directed RNA polymerase subunit omega [Planctomycetes bacterium]|nr:DNA-directed RNA polymerase subunit omega [Planctomycetota bacterium]
MIEELKNDDLITKVGGRFRLTALIQRRLVELLQGARPMVETKGLTDIEVVVKELAEDKIAAKDYVFDSEIEDDG